MNKNFIKVLFWANAFFFVTNMVFVLIGVVLFGVVEWINIFAAAVCLAGLWTSQQMQEL